MNAKIKIYELKNDELTVKVTNYGCHIMSIYAKDRNGVAEDVVLFYEDLMDCNNDGAYLGAVVGRVANRIGKGTFDLNGTTYHLAINNGPNHLHGGMKGFDSKVFDAEEIDQGVIFTYLSPDMEEGYPGNLNVKVTYTLEGNTLHIDYEAVSDKDTLCNLTNHSYFNLSAGRDKIYGHELTIDADLVASVDGDGCTCDTGKQVDGTPFDFRVPHTVGERINDEDEQLKLANGYDHSFVLNQGKDAIVLYDPESGRKLTMSTTMPDVQIYSGNFLAGGCKGKHGKPYENRDGIALETQFLPDGIHLEAEPDDILKAGEVMKSRTSYRFEAE